MRNRRTARRAPMVATAMMMLRQGKKEREYLALTTRDISRSGAFLRSHELPPVGACGKLEIVLHSSGVKLLTGQPQFGVILNAWVTRVSEDGFAVAFDHSNDSAELAA